MKKTLTHFGVGAAALILALVSCTKEKAGKQVPDGALVHFTIASNEVETRTVYGEKYEDPYDGNRKKQQILWKVGDEVIIIMYDPDNFADHQKATYVVVDTPEDMTWKPEVAHHRALVKIKDMDGNEPLRWNKEWTKRKFAAYFVPSMQEAYQTEWLGNSPQGVIDPDLGSDKGVGYIPFHNNQPRFMFKGVGTSHVEAVPNMYYAHMFSEQEIEPTKLDDLDVTLVFNSIFTNFEITFDNPLDHEIGLLGVVVEDENGGAVSGALYTTDITNPLSYQVVNPSKYAGVFIYQFDNYYANSVEHPEVWSEYKTMAVPANGTLTLTIFCLPKTYSRMRLRVYYDIVRNVGGAPAGSLGPNMDKYAQDILPLKSSSGSYFSFTASHKHVLHVGIPEDVENWMHGFGY